MGAIQYLSKYIENLSAQADIHRKLLKKQIKWEWTEEHTNAFNNLKKLITQLPYLAHYNPKSENILTTDASTKGLGATLWQKQKDGNLKPIGFASRFLSDTEKKYAINELELLAVVWVLEHFRLYIFGKPIELLTDHQALEPLIKRNRSNTNLQRKINKMVRQISAFRYSNKARCRQTFEINRLLKQKSNFKAGANRKLRRRVRNQLHNPLTGVYQQLRQHHR